MLPGWYDELVDMSPLSAASSVPSKSPSRSSSSSLSLAGSGGGGGDADAEGDAGVRCAAAADRGLGEPPRFGGIGLSALLGWLLRSMVVVGERCRDVPTAAAQDEVIG